MEKVAGVIAFLASNTFVRTFALELLKAIAKRTKNTYDDDLVKALETAMKKTEK